MHNLALGGCQGPTAHTHMHTHTHTHALGQEKHTLLNDTHTLIKRAAQHLHTHCSKRRLCVCGPWSTHLSPTNTHCTDKHTLLQNKYTLLKDKHFSKQLPYILRTLLTLLTKLCRAAFQVVGIPRKETCKRDL